MKDILISYIVADNIEADQSITPTPVPRQGGFFGDILGRQETIEILRPVNTDFGIVIPKIAANSRVVAQVDASNYEEYIKALVEGVAQAQGTYFPGEGGNIYLFAHSTDNFWNVGRYNAVFYLLKELNVGDEIDLYYKGVRYRYEATGREIVDPDDVHFLTNPTDSEILTLQTCWPPGTTLKRLIILAKPVSQLQAN